MLYNEHNLKVAKIASRGGIKPVLECVLFTKDKSVATDSFRLLEVSVPKNAKAGEFPKVQGHSVMQGVKPFLARAREVEKIKIPKKAKLPILEHFGIKHVDNHHAEFLSVDKDGESVQITNALRVDDQFPDYEKIFPTGKPVAEVDVNAFFLSEILEIMGGMNKHDARITIKIYGEGKPVVVVAGNDNQSARAMIMPVVR